MKKHRTGFGHKLVWTIPLALVAILSLLLPQGAMGQRTYTSNWAANAPTLDGVASAGEWDSAVESGAFKVLRSAAPGDTSTENVRIRVLWTDSALYFLVVSDYGGWNGPVGPINFSADNINILFDPNGDGESNDDLPGRDSYQVALSQPLSDTVLTEADTPVFLEGHINADFGGAWNATGIQTAQINTAAGGTLEMCIPFSDLNITEDGMEHTDPPVNGEKWFLQVGRISSDAANLLPVWSYHEGQAFANRPMGVLTFQHLGSLTRGFSLRQLDLSNAGGAEAIDNHPEAENFLDNTGDTGLNLNVQNDLQLQRSVVDIAGGGGNYPVNDPYLDGQSGTGKEDVTVRATSTVTIPPGTWSIAFGSDDGGQVTVTGVNFVNKFRENGPVQGPDSVRFDGNRGHQWTGGTFTNASEITTTLIASFHERGGGDSFELAIREASADGGDPLVNEFADDPNTGAENGWNLLSDGMCGWQLVDDGVSCIWVGGKARIGAQPLAVVTQNEVVTVVQEPAVLYYDFEDNSDPATVVDLSPSGNNGTVVNNVTFVDGGAPAGASPTRAGRFSVGAAGYINIPSLDVPTVLSQRDSNPDGSYTLSAWLRPDAVSLSGDRFFFGQTNQGIHNGLRGAGTLNTAHWGSDFAAATPLTADTWIHALWTYDGATNQANIYLNGVLDGGPFNQLGPNGGGNMILGGRNGGTQNYAGDADEVAIWAGVLDSAQITDLAGGASPGTVTVEKSVITSADRVATVPQVRPSAAPSSGAWSANGGAGVVNSKLTSPVLTIPADGAYTVSVNHRYNFEDDGTTRWDGGALFASVDGGPFTYVDASAFTENPYDGADAGEDGRVITGNSPPLNGLFGFNNTSPGFADGDYITSTVDLGALTAGQTVAVQFIGAWDEGFIQTPAPNWEIANATVFLDGAEALVLDFNQGLLDFTVENTGNVAGPWVHPAQFTPVPYKFDLDGNAKTADSLNIPANPDPALFTQAIDLNDANIEVSIATGTPSVGDVYQLFNAGGSLFKLDFAHSGPNASGTAAGWDPIGDGALGGLDQDTSFALTDQKGSAAGVTITALDDNFNPNISGAPGTGASFDDIEVPQSVFDDYLFKQADTPGTTARLRIDGLPAGDYNVTVFEGRTTDSSQFGKIWAGGEGDEPAAENTGDFAGGGQTVKVTVTDGDAVYYTHLEDGSGGISGMIIQSGNHLVGNYASLSLPEGQWDSSGLEPGGNGTLVFLDPARSGWLVRGLNTVEAPGTTTGAEVFLNTPGSATVLEDVSMVIGVLDLAGGGGNYPVNNPYPNGVNNANQNNFSIMATADVVIPAGTWSAAFASDDGGSVTIPGVIFTDKFNEDVTRGDDSVVWEAPRGHTWTGGTFTLAEPLTTTITVVMYENGGGDSLEFAIRDSSADIPTGWAGDGSWELATQGTLGWSITTLGMDARHVAGMGVIGTETLTGTRANEVFDLAETTPGLTQEWYQAGNPGNLAGVQALIAANDPTEGPAKGETGTWWTGNGGAISGIQTYPTFTNGMARDNYVVSLEGEIFIPEDGTINFKDGVDDYTYLEIDGEALIDDNTWTGVEGNQNGGSPIVSKTFDVADGGEWLPITMYVAEGGGGDAGILYWDYQTCDPAASYFQSFDGFADGTTDLLDGSVMAGTANVQGNQLELTRDGVAGGFASFSVPPIAGSENGFTASFNLTIIDSAAANPPADGMSFNYGNAALGTLGAAEEGIGVADASENLSFEIDTWMNFDAEQGVNISGNAAGADVGQLAFNNGPILDDGTTVTGRVFISWDPVNGASYTTTGLLTNADFSGIATTFTPDAGHTFILSGRVGGANETKLIDNLSICTGGAGLNAGVGFPTAVDQAVDLAANGRLLLVPDTHLRGQIIGLVSADLVATLDNSKPWEFEIGDLIEVSNPDAAVFSSVIDLTGADIVLTGDPQAGDVIQLFAAGTVLQGNYGSLSLPTLPDGLSYLTDGLEPGGDGTIIVIEDKPFEITGIVKTPADVTLTFNSVPGAQTYAIDATTDATMGNVFKETLETYPLGNSDGLGVWADFGGTRTADIVDTFASTGSQSIAFSTNPGYGSDSTADLAAPITSGQVRVSFDILVPAAFDGQARIYVSRGATLGGAFQEGIDLTGDGTAGTFGDSGSPTTPLLVDQWVNVSMDINLDTDSATATYGGTEIYNGPWVNGGDLPLQFQGINIWATAGAVVESFYIDNLCLSSKSSNQWEEIAAGIASQGTSTTVVLPDSNQPAILPGLLGGDLTDPEDDGEPDANVGYNAVFDASEEADFGGGEFAFNIFDGGVGGGNEKWCCGTTFPLWASAEFNDGPKALTHFTVTSSNDTPTRDPRVWEIQGSNDGGATWNTIFRQDDSSAGLWTGRSQTLLFEAGLHFAPPPAYAAVRIITFETGATTGAFYALAEVEFFDDGEVKSGGRKFFRARKE